VATSRFRRSHGTSAFAALAVALFSILITAAPATAQLLDTVGPRPRFGIFGDFVRSVHTADIPRLAGRSDIPYNSRFDGGTGGGLAFGALVELPLSETIWLVLRGSLQSESAEMTASEATTVIVNDSTEFRAVFERRIDASITTAGIEPMIGVVLPLGFTASVGGRAGFVVSSSFEQDDRIVEPIDQGAFEDGRRIRNEFSGDIPGVAAMQASALIGISRELAINRRGTWFLVPELMASYGLTPVSDSVDWNAHGLRFGIALKYSPLPAPPVIAVIPEPEPEPEPVVPPVLMASVRAGSVEADGTERPDVTIRVEEFISTQMRPLLNYVFFDEGSATIPSRYRSLAPADAARFDVGELFGKGTLETYYDVLNIIGRRLVQMPRASITLTGTNAGVGAEKGNMALSQQRAEAVRAYLTSAWGIEQDRIKIRARNLPEVASDTAQAEAAAENRRVEISSNDPALLDAVLTDDTVRTVTPPMVRFRPTVRSEAGVGSWELSARQGDVLVASFSGKGEVPETIEWKPSETRSFSTKSTAPITYALQVRDDAGQQVAAEPGRLSVEQVTLRRKREEGATDKRTDRYGMILFDYDRSDLNAANEKIAGLIRSRIPAGATVSITAFTDRIGEAEHNQRLSEARARATARALGVDASRAIGVGETRELFDNNLPEGRFYSRTVEILVESQVR
jgi:outer membrane protein OmpA-like peptidoglycan-associated protein